jgi:hypothetical protein
MIAKTLDSKFGKFIATIKIIIIDLLTFYPEKLILIKKIKKVAREHKIPLSE